MRALLILLVLLPALARAADPPGLRPSITGAWVLSAETRRVTRAPCRGLRLTFTANGQLLRQSGKLKYRTAVELTPEGPGWLLTEKVLAHNGQASCAGQPALTVLRQLGFHQAYIEVGDLWLRYYRDKGDRKPMTYVRVPKVGKARPAH